MTSDELPVTVADGLPERIGRYRVTGRVGKGAMGVVYSAYDEVMGREVAIKVLMADLEGDPTMRARFYREAQAAGRLLHRNIITVFDIGEDDGRAFIVMELLKGRTLPDFIRSARVQLEEKVDLMAQMCEGLHAAHSQGIFHRDIKPGNLFVLADGTLKILDFGVARLASSTLTGTGAVIGTPDYMAPEQARGQEVDARSDVFSSAAVFYFMLAGRNPFTASTLPGILRKVQFEDPPSLEERDAPRGLWHIVAKGLAKQPFDRYRSAIEMFSDLVKFRREYEAETRDIAAAALRRVRDIQALVNERGQLARSLGTEDPGANPIVVNLLRDEAPAFVQQSPDAVLMVPFTRRQIESLGAELHAEHGRLIRSVEPLRVANAALEAGERLLSEGNLDGALKRFEEAGRIVPTAERLRLAGARFYQLRAERSAPACTPSVVQQTTPVVGARHGEAVELSDVLETPAVRPQAHEPVAVESAKRGRDHEAGEVSGIRAGHPGDTEPVEPDAAAPTRRADAGTRFDPWSRVRDAFGWSRATRLAVLAGAAVLTLTALAATGYRVFVAGNDRVPSSSRPVSGDRRPDEAVQPAAPAPPDSAPSSSRQPSELPAAAATPKSEEHPARGASEGPAGNRASGRAAEGAASSRSRPTVAATTRARLLEERYARATAALTEGDVAAAIAGFESVLAEQPTYADAATLLNVARERAAKQTARREYEAGMRAAAAGDHLVALQHLEQASKSDSSFSDAQRAIASIREKVRVDGEDAYKRAKQYDALGRTAEAIAMYDKAMLMLPADHPLRANARERLEALRAIK